MKKQNKKDRWTQRKRETKKQTNILTNKPRKLETKKEIV